MYKNATMFVKKAYATSTTTSTSNPGQVQTKSDGDVLYLGTTTNDNSEHTSNGVTSISEQNSTFFSSSSQIVIPSGFVQDLGVYLSSVINLVMVACLLLVLFHFIQAGLQWITSGGDKGKTEEARNRITHAFIGILIVSASFATAGFVAYLLGFDSYQEILTAIPPINTI